MLPGILSHDGGDDLFSTMNFRIFSVKYIVERAIYNNLKSAHISINLQLL